MMKNHLFLFLFCLSPLTLCAPTSPEEKLKKKLEEARMARTRNSPEILSGSAVRAHNKAVNCINRLLGRRADDAAAQSTKSRPAEEKPLTGHQRRALKAAIREAINSAVSPNLVDVPSSYALPGGQLTDGRLCWGVQSAAKASAQRRVQQGLENGPVDRTGSILGKDSHPLLKWKVERLQRTIEALQRLGTGALNNAKVNFADLGQQNQRLRAEVAVLQGQLNTLKAHVAEQNEKSQDDRLLLQERVAFLEDLTEEMLGQDEALSNKADALYQILDEHKRCSVNTSSRHDASLTSLWKAVISLQGQNTELLGRLNSQLRTNAQLLGRLNSQFRTQ
jgi:hypothetical protein